MKAGPVAEEPAQRRTAEIVVRDLGDEEMTEALTSTLLTSTGELWLLTCKMKQNGQPYHSKG